MTFARRSHGTSNCWVGLQTRVRCRKCQKWRFPGGGWLQVYESKQRAGAGSVTLAVENLEEQMSELAKLGIDPGLPLVGKVVKVVMIKDPDGNSLAFAQATDPRMAH